MRAAESSRPVELFFSLKPGIREVDVVRGLKRVYFSFSESSFADSVISSHTDFSMPYALVPTSNEANPVPLNKAIILFGRNPDCDVVITSSRKVSRRHCCIAQINNDFVVRDLGSMNGIRVNGTVVKRSQRLKLHDELCVGDVLFRLKEASASEKQRKPAPQPAPPAVPNHLVSQEVPVIIPDESHSFAVEESLVKSPTDSEIPIELGEESIIEEDDSEELETIG